MEKAGFLIAIIVYLAYSGAQAVDEEELRKNEDGSSWWNETANVKLHALALNRTDPGSLNLFLQQQNVHVATYIHPNLYIVVAPPSSISKLLLYPQVTSSFVWGGSVVITQSMKDAVFPDIPSGSVCRDSSTWENIPPKGFKSEANKIPDNWVVDQDDRVVIEVVLPQVPGIDFAACRLALQQVDPLRLHNSC